jgi:hypothetical protein
VLVVAGEDTHPPAGKATPPHARQLQQPAGLCTQLVDVVDVETTLPVFHSLPCLNQRFRAAIHNNNSGLRGHLGRHLPHHQQSHIAHEVTMSVTHTDFARKRTASTPDCLVTTTRYT